ncbi:lysophospholipase [Sphingomonas jinjuensis]|uniref:Lysophospholipase n=1 Tax=Sphingomonas jinjuensis TaxID=535907 RepID=A0A840FI12_9SPHN|nr:alpha/beta hydrolase [Sphingomonas jinjuensis]MBB4155344.1 lysophospholipase [Sphingomonas jinjuensis]
MARSDPTGDVSEARRRLPDRATISRWTTPDGWPLRRFDWPATGTRGRIMVQGGRGDFIEKYLETFAHFHGLGWQVTAFDWRGQGGSGRLSRDANVGHATDFAPWIADLAALWAQWRGEGTGPAVLLGHSMGGYLALRAMAEGAVTPDAAILVAPMLGLKAPMGARFGAAIARWMAARGDPARAAWKTNERPGGLANRAALLTGDAARYADELWWHDAEPTLRLGPPSWSWLAQAFAGTLALEADPRLATLRVPTLMLVADRDRLVDARAAIRVATRLPDAELVRFGPESAHEILRERDAVRDRAFAAIDAFLDAKAPVTE